MSILIDETTRVVMQGLTGDVGRWSARDLTSYGTPVVAGVVPGRGGGSHDGIPLFNFVADAVAETGANASIAYVPPSAAAEAVAEALDAELPLVVYPGDGLPSHDAVRLRQHSRSAGSVFIGPNSPGLISPGRAKLGFMPSSCYVRGQLGVISRSGSLSYEICSRLTSAGIGQSTVVGVGGDPVKGLTIGEALDLFDRDLETHGVLVLGEIGGTQEHQAAEYARRSGTKPLAAFLVGQSAPPGRKLGHAGALIDGDRDTYRAKVDDLISAGVHVAERIGEVIAVARAVLSQ